MGIKPEWSILKAKDKEKSKSISGRLTCLYIRKIKKWMFCPSCQKGKMTIGKGSALWTCVDCGYQLSASELEDDYVFWFCDECGAYLNIQEGFDRQARRHICRDCGYENDITFDNLKGICSDCGKTIPDPDSTLCADCALVRHKKAKERIIKAAKFTGTAALVAGAAYLAAQSDGEESGSYLDEDIYDEGGTQTGLDYVTGSWMETASEDELRTAAREMESLMDELDYGSEEYGKIYGIHIDVVNAIASRFPLNLPHREHGWYLPNDD